MALADGDEKKPVQGRRSPQGRGKTSPSTEGGLIPDLLRRGLSLGFTGFFMTEEALRRALGDSLPRDWMEFMVDQSERTRAELLDRLSREFGRVISAFDPVEILRRLLDGQTIEVSASIRLSNGGRRRRSEPPAAPDDGDGE